MEMLTAPSTCRISAHARHCARKVTVRDHALIWIHSGTKTLLSARDPQRIRRGDAVVMLQGSLWDVLNEPQPDTRYEATVLQFGEQAISYANRYLSPWAPKPTEPNCHALHVDDELAQAIKRVEATSSRSETGGVLRMHRTVEVLLLLAERGIRLESRSQIGWPDRIRRAVVQHPHAQWTTDALSALFHVSSSTLRRRLAESGASASNLIRNARLEVGLLLLQTTESPVGEIAQRCGYLSHSSFTAAFRLRYGFSPSELRDSPQQAGLSALA